MIENKEDHCAQCGMTLDFDEYHPYAACLMFTACHDSEAVHANLEAVLARGYKGGVDASAQGKGTAP